MISGFRAQLSLGRGETILVSIFDYAPERSIPVDFFEAIYKFSKKSRRLKSHSIIVRAPVDHQFSGLEITEAISENRSNNAFLEYIANSIFDETSTLYRRFKNIPVQIIYTNNYCYFLTKSLTNTKELLAAGPLKSEFLMALRSSELVTLAGEGGAIYEQVPGVPYQTPSGRHATKFLRVGNIQRSRSAINSLFFWLLPYLRNCTGILVETWSISSIAYDASRLLLRYDSTREDVPPVDMMNEYHTGKEERRDLGLAAIRRLISLCDGNGHVLFLFSATQTGSLHTNIVGSLEKDGVDKSLLKFLAIYRLASSSSMDCLCDLSSEGFSAFEANADRNKPAKAAQRTETEENPSAKAITASDPREANEESHLPTIGSEMYRSSIGKRKGRFPLEPAIRIDPRTFFPQFDHEIEIKIRRSLTKRFEKFFNDYGDLGVFRVHYTRQDDRKPRHHAIYIDTELLVGSEVFTKRLYAHLDEYDRSPSIVVSPPHKAGRALSALVAEYFERKMGTQVRSFHHSNLYRRSSDNEELFGLLADADVNDEIFVVDDAFMSGSRLSLYQQHLRDLEFRGKVRYLVAISRPESRSEWEESRNLLAFRSEFAEDRDKWHSLSCIESLVLPDWGIDDCPWCREQFFLSKILQRSDYDLSIPEIFTRFTFLRNSSVDGLQNELFWRLGEQDNLMLGPDSIFTKSRKFQSTIFAAVSALFQHLRTGNDLDVNLGRQRYPIATIIKSEEHLCRVFTDSVLRACFFRAAFVEELAYRDKDREKKRSDLAMRIMQNDSGVVNNLAMELLFACVEGKVSLVDYVSSDISGEIREKFEKIRNLI